MNHTARNLIRFTGVIVGLGAAVWALRDRLLPAPEIHDEPPPRFREAATRTVSAATAEAIESSLTDIKGVGPVTADKLIRAGFTDISKVAGAKPAVLADAVGTSESVADKWITSAKSLT
jgi:predicted flap endonuclease-1-like 5' DNA nuclease